MAACSFCPVNLSFPKLTPQNSSDSLLRATSFKPIAITKPFPTLELSRLKFIHPIPVAVKPKFRAPAISIGDSPAFPEAESSNSKKQDAIIDIKLPRRSLSVEFTCDGCGERTKRLINRLAYERGVVYVQCAGCEKYHNLVDNLGIVVEYDLRDENVNKVEAC